jgi:hypothetical protein
MENQAAKARLDVARWASESVVKIKMAKGRLDVVSPKQAHDPPAEPNALGITGRAGNHTLSLSVLVDLMELVLARRSRLVSRFPVRALGKGWGRQRGYGNSRQQDRSEQSAGEAQHTMGHRFDLVWAATAE